MLNLQLKNPINTRIMIAKTGKNIRQFANEIGISSPYMSLVLTGKRNPSPKTAYKIANGLGVEVEELFSIEAENLNEAII